MNISSGWRQTFHRMLKRMSNGSADAARMKRDCQLAEAAMDCRDEEMTLGHIRNLKRGTLAYMVYADFWYKTNKETLDMSRETLDLLAQQSRTLEELTCLLGGDKERSGKRWTDEEDSELVNLRSEGWDIEKISYKLKRTSAAVATRLSYLVGVRKEVMRINGRRIEGFLNDAYANGKFEGVVYSDEVR